MFPEQHGDKIKAQFVEECDDVKGGVIFPRTSNSACFENHALEPETILLNKLPFQLWSHQ